MVSTKKTLELAALALYLVITVLIHFTSTGSVMFSIGAHSSAFIVYSIFVRRLINSVEETVVEVSHESYKEHSNFQATLEQVMPNDVFTVEKTFNYLVVLRLFASSTLHMGGSLGIYNLISKCLTGTGVAILVSTVIAHFVYSTHEGIVALFMLTSLPQVAVCANLLFFACLYGTSGYEMTTVYQELISRTIDLEEKSLTHRAQTRPT